MYVDQLVGPTPVAEIDGDGVVCIDCGQPLIEHGYFDGGVGGYYCESCGDKLLQAKAPEAECYAQEHCRITRRLPKYDWEYDTPEAFMARCRHECTNYNDLIRPLDRDAVLDRLCYLAVHNRVQAILIEEFERTDEVAACAFIGWEI